MQRSRNNSKHTIWSALYEKSYGRRSCLVVFILIERAFFHSLQINERPNVKLSSRVMKMNSHRWRVRPVAILLKRVAGREEARAYDNRMEHNQESQPERVLSK